MHCDGGVLPELPEQDATVPLAPVVAGAVKVTAAPEMGLLLASVTYTARPVGNFVSTWADWPLPATGCNMAGLDATIE
jgi:hypothetical protein